MFVFNTQKILKSLILQFVKQHMSKNDMSHIHKKLEARASLVALSSMQQTKLLIQW